MGLARALSHQKCKGTPHSPRLCPLSPLHPEAFSRRLRSWLLTTAPQDGALHVQMRTLSLEARAQVASVTLTVGAHLLSPARHSFSLWGTQLSPRADTSGSTPQFMELGVGKYASSSPCRWVGNSEEWCTASSSSALWGCAPGVHSGKLLHNTLCQLPSRPCLMASRFHQCFRVSSHINSCPLIQGPLVRRAN